MKKVISVILMMLMCALAGCDTETPVNDSDTSAPEAQEQVLVDDDNIKVTFVEVFEEPSIAGAGYLRLKVTNKTDKTVTVYPKDAYVNDMAVTLGSGVPMTLASGKSSQAPFIIFYSNIGITSKDEIEKIELKLTFDDENYDTIVETETLVIDRIR